MSFLFEAAVEGCCSGSSPVRSRWRALVYPLRAFAMRVMAPTDTAARLEARSVDTYKYLGSTDSVIVDVSTAGTGNTLNAAIDSMGDRLATAASNGFAWIVPDLHGNVAAQCGSSGSITDVFRYDAYGNIIGTSTFGSVPSPWRYQGRILESTAGSDTYDFGARAYVPDLGTFTSLDSVSGSAQNPLSLNRYLYADANPATLVDPDGHCAAPGGECSTSQTCYTSYESGFECTYNYPVTTTKKKIGSSYGGAKPNTPTGCAGHDVDITKCQVSAPSDPFACAGHDCPATSNPATGPSTPATVTPATASHLQDGRLVMTLDGVPVDEENAALAASMCQYQYDETACAAYRKWPRNSTGVDIIATPVGAVGDVARAVAPRIGRFGGGLLLVAGGGLVTTIGVTIVVFGAGDMTSAGVETAGTGGFAAAVAVIQATGAIGLITYGGVETGVGVGITVTGLQNMWAAVFDQ